MLRSQDELDELSTAGSTTASQSDLGSGTLGAVSRRKGPARRPGGGGDSGDEGRSLFVQPQPPAQHPARPSSARQVGSAHPTTAAETVDDLEVLRQQQQRQQPRPHRAATAASGRGGAAKDEKKKSRGIQWHPAQPPPSHQTSLECESNAGSVASEPVWGSAQARSGRKVRRLARSARAARAPPVCHCTAAFLRTTPASSTPTAGGPEAAALCGIE